MSNKVSRKSSRRISQDRHVEKISKLRNKMAKLIDQLHNEADLHKKTKIAAEISKVGSDLRKAGTELRQNSRKISEK